MAVKTKTEKDYLAIAAKRVHRPSKIVTPRRVLAYGRNKKGKTRFALSAGIDTTLVVDPENGTDTMKALDPYVWPVEKWEDLQDVMGALRTGKLSPNTLKQGNSSTPFTWVSFDGVTRMNNFGLRYIMRKQEEVNLDRRPGIIDRRDYNKSGELLKEFLTQAMALKMNVVFTAQERVETVGADDEEEGEESTWLVPDLPKGVRGTINSLVDVIGRIYTARVNVKRNGEVVEVIQRRLWIGPHDRFDTGYRSDFVLPDYIKQPTLPKLVDLMLTGELPSK
jgi:hypothetical protein